MLFAWTTDIGILLTEEFVGECRYTAVALVVPIKLRALVHAASRASNWLTLERPARTLLVSLPLITLVLPASGCLVRHLPGLCILVALASSTT